MSHKTIANHQRFLALPHSENINKKGLESLHQNHDYSFFYAQNLPNDLAIHKFKKKLCNSYFVTYLTMYIFQLTLL